MQIFRPLPKRAKKRANFFSMKITIKLDTRRAKADGCYPIKFKVAHNQQNAFINTPYAVKEAMWNDNASEVRSTFIRAKEINDWLKGKLLEYQKRLLTMSEEYSVTEIRDRLVADYSIEHTFRQVYQEHVARYSGKTLQSYEYMFDKVTAFCPLVEWNVINYAWLMDFNDWLRSTGLSIDSSSMVLRSLRALCNYAVKCDYIEKYPFKRFSIPSTPASQRRKKDMALSVEQLKEVFGMDLSDSPALSWARDILWLSFILGGINLVDLYNLPRLGDDCRVEYVREKTKRFEPEPVRLDLSGLPTNLLSRVQSLSVGGNIIDRRGKLYEDFYNTHKKALQRLSRLVGYNVSLYSVRYSWATIAAKLGVSVAVINRVQAHTDGGNVSERYYINFDWSAASAAVVKVAEYMR